MGGLTQPMDLMLGACVIKRKLVQKIIHVTTATKNGRASLANLTKENAPFK